MNGVFEGAEVEEAGFVEAGFEGAGFEEEEVEEAGLGNGVFHGIGFEEAELEVTHFQTRLEEAEFSQGWMLIGRRACPSGLRPD